MRVFRGESIHAAAQTCGPDMSAAHKQRGGSGPLMAGKCGARGRAHLPA
jgi:hypothetical protein